MIVEQILQRIGDIIWGWPLIGFIMISGVILTIALRGIQFRYFVKAWQYVIYPEHTRDTIISPFQAFLNILGASVGNGSLTGMATAIYSGGPGAAFWVFVLGFFTMPIRFAEVFMGTSHTVTLADGTLRGGPMAYIPRVPGGTFLVYAYVFFCLMETFVAGNAMQCQAITKSVTSMVTVDVYLVAGILCAFILYILLGGAQRVLAVSDAVVPAKVGLFFISIVCALGYHYSAIPEAIRLIMSYAFTQQAVVGGVIGYTMQDAIRYSMSRVLNATEVGLGTAGILYGGTGSKDPVRSGIMAMPTSFITNYIVCFSIMLLIIVSGAWKSGIHGTGMLIAAYETVFGSSGSLIVSILSAMFGFGVLVAYAYIGRECWIFLTGGRYMLVYQLLYASMALFGSLAQVALVWNSIDIVVAGLVIINVYALLMQLPAMQRAVRAYPSK